jgi:hypothetical protein
MKHLPALKPSEVSRQKRFLRPGTRYTPSLPKYAAMQTLLDLLAKWALARCFFITKEGSIGLGSRTTAVDDRIAILSTHGNAARTPFAVSLWGVDWNLVREAYTILRYGLGHTT